MSTDQQQKWNNFVKRAPGSSFLQSWEWGQFQRAAGLRIHRLTTDHAAAQVVVRPLPFGHSWLTIPYGPLFKDAPTPENWLPLEQQLLNIARQENAIFIHLEPAEADISWLGERWQPSSRRVQPQHTVVLDLTKGENELLAAMHHKTRYNIRLAERKGVRVRFSQDAHDLAHFLALAHDVSGRTDFHYHSDDYYQRLLQVLTKPTSEVGYGSGAVEQPRSPRVELAIAETSRTPLAAHILITFNDTVTYAHGASSNEQRELMAPHLLQWESIKHAKHEGLQKYDFFGVAPPNSPAARAGAGRGGSHPWSGITRFKEGFGGTRLDHGQAYEHILNPTLYHTYIAAKTILNKLRFL